MNFQGNKSHGNQLPPQYGAVYHAQPVSVAAPSPSAPLISAPSHHPAPIIRGGRRSVCSTVVAVFALVLNATGLLGTFVGVAAGYQDWHAYVLGLITVPFLLSSVFLVISATCAQGKGAATAAFALGLIELWLLTAATTVMIWSFFVDCENAYCEVVGAVGFPFLFVSLVGVTLTFVGVGMEFYRRRGVLVSEPRTVHPCFVVSSVFAGVQTFTGSAMLLAVFIIIASYVGDDFGTVATVCFAGFFASLGSVATLFHVMAATCWSRTPAFTMAAVVLSTVFVCVDLVMLGATVYAGVVDDPDDNGYWLQDDLAALAYPGFGIAIAGLLLTCISSSCRYHTQSTSHSIYQQQVN